MLGVLHIIRRPVPNPRGAFGPGLHGSATRVSDILYKFGHLEPPDMEGKAQHVARIDRKNRSVMGPARAAAKPVLPQDVTSTPLPGVIGGGQKWKMAWQGEAPAHGMVGTDDGGLIFAQEQSNRIIKIALSAAYL